MQLGNRQIIRINTYTHYYGKCSGEEVIWCCNGSTNWEQHSGCLEKAGLWGGDKLGEQASLSAMSALSHPVAVVRKKSVLEDVLASGPKAHLEETRLHLGLLWWLSGKELACKCGRLGFQP